ncbi:MAG: FtsH protease activity modulator HflK [Azoarcus sp.]|nr:FtsH protease activity modulator HflK [Azoarcus sp.]
MSVNDPRWGNRDGNDERGGRRGGNQGPPDLEEIWREFNQRLSGIFGGRRNTKPSGPGNGGPRGPEYPFSFKQFGRNLGFLVLLVLVIWLCSGFYIVDTNERGVVLHLGEYKYTSDPGLHWCLPRPIETHEIVDFTGLRTVSVGGQGSSRAQMLTDDLNIVNVQFAVQYVLKAEAEDGPQNFIFKNRNPDEDFVRQVAETAMRAIVGNSKMDFVLYEGREQIAGEAQKLVQEILDRYESGIQVSRVTMEGVQPPEDVQAAFDDATRATQDWERQKNEGEAYANKVIPEAQGTASRLRADAEGYRARVLAGAEGETSRFTQILTEFKRAPQVTRERMYIETVQQVFSNVSKVMVDHKGGNNVLFLPLDKIAQQVAGMRAASGVAATPVASVPVVSEPVPTVLSPRGDSRDRNVLRDRERGER